MPSGARRGPLRARCGYPNGRAEAIGARFLGATSVLVVTVTAHVPWRAPVVPLVPDVDHMGAAVPGLVATAMRLSGTRS
jgi:hypothetical protein